ncbi:MAG: hypothetical protein MI861_17990 [Pirellulales bacterium]|nr:hypothetical protein [Pirellulales bacterium]
MVSDETEAASKSGFDGGMSEQNSAASWLFCGLIVSVLIMGSANALSFFFLSRGWGSLLGSREFGDEAIGFPLTIWEESAGYGSHAMKMGPFLIDVAFTLILGVMIGLVAIRKRQTLGAIMDRFRQEGTAEQVRFQFSLSGLLITTVLAALAAAGARALVPRVELLAAIYALGPASLILLAYLPRRLRWQQRVAIVAPATLILIAVAIALGSVLDVEFDKVLMGIFICWTPQAATGAIALTAWLMLREYRAMKTA